MAKATYHIRYLHAHNLIRDIDIQFAELLNSLAGETAGAELALAAALASHTTSDEKHICLDLEAAAGRPLTDLFAEVPEKCAARLQRLRTPSVENWADRLKATPVVGAPGEYRPLVLDAANRLYLYRYWAYEHQLAAAIRARAEADRIPVDPDLLNTGLDRYFPPSEQSPDWQRVAAFTAVTGRLSIISGGPGTGKTHTVTHILALLLEQNETLRMAICAPTGKAAARIQESIKHARQALDFPPHILAGIPENAKTIHRLLGFKTDSPYFYHDAGNPLPLDVLIVDEASMVSLALMAKLMQAAPAGCRVILLGDRNQLASVEAGAVLGDICAAADTGRFSKAFCKQYAGGGIRTDLPGCNGTGTALSDCTVELQFSYRFAETSAIGRVSRAVNSGEAEAALAGMDDPASETIARGSLPAPERLADHLSELLDNRYNGLFSAPDVAEAFAALEAFRILCSHRRGPYGVEGINRCMEAILEKRGRIDPAASNYVGRPILINRNDYNLGLYNGDVGIIWPDAAGELRAWFPDQTGGFRALAPSRLPAHETVFAMTIHKSQGSEFDRILMVLPPVDSPIFTRELVYTGITRARRRVDIWADEKILKAAIQARVKRRSGLRDSLQKTHSGVQTRD